MLKLLLPNRLLLLSQSSRRLKSLPRPLLLLLKQPPNQKLLPQLLNKSSHQSFISTQYDSVFANRIPL
jgi:hypothetical protein